MADFLLLHGMNVGGWEFERLVPLLRADPRTGTVVAPDMPGRAGNRPGRLHEVRLADYVETAVAALRDNDLRDTVVVGHSGGGAYLQAVVAAEPERVRRMVFLCAAVPQRGRSLLELQPLPFRLISRAFMWLFRTKRRGIRANARLARRALCHDLRPEDCGPFLGRLTPEPEALLLDRIDWPPERVRAPGTYIITTQDRVIRPQHQRRMAGNILDVKLVTFDMGHARPVAEPERLAALLLGEG
jgi:pimeloyl-ACP methyl ester carboxylesterase